MSINAAAAQPNNHGRRWRAVPYAVAIASLGLSALVAAPAQAAGFVVTNLNDAGEGSLRAAIVSANASPGADTITFDVAGGGTISLTSGALEIEEGVTITGPGSGQLSLDGGGLDRHFDIHADSAGGSAVVISGMTLRNGKAPADPAAVTPGDLLDGGAIVASSAGGGALTLDHVVITQNTGGDGGAVQSSGLALTITDSTISHNISQFGGGAVRTFDCVVVVNDSVVSENSAVLSGGGFRISGGSLAMQGSTVHKNDAGSAGGLRAATGATVAITDSTFTENRATGVGVTGNGGAMVLDNLPAGSSAIRNSLISGNTASANGGGLDVGTGDVSVENVTLVGNSAGNEGGGIRFNGGTTTVTGATITGNAAVHGGGVLSTGPGATVRSSILAGNTATDPAENDLTVRILPGDDPIHLDYSLVQTQPISGTFTAPTPGSDLFGQDPLLAALGDNGGATWSRLPLNGSPVLDHGRSFGLAEDQRGRIRPVDLAGVGNAAGGDGADMGAVEASTGSQAVQNLAVPTIAGTAQLGLTLSATGAGSWNPVNVTLSRQWLRNGVPVPGATGTSYLLGVADVGTRISLRVTGSMSGYAPTPAASAPSAIVGTGNLVLAGTPRIVGRLKVGRTLVAVAPVARPAATVRYQWLRNGRPVAGATKARYRLRKADARKRMSVKVTYVQSGYTPRVILIRRAGTVRR